MIRGIYAGIAYVDIVLDLSGLGKRWPLGWPAGATRHVSCVQIGKALTDFELSLFTPWFTLNMMQYHVRDYA